MKPSPEDCHKVRWFRLDKVTVAFLVAVALLSLVFLTTNEMKFGGLASAPQPPSRPVKATRDSLEPEINEQPYFWTSIPPGYPNARSLNLTPPSTPGVGASLSQLVGQVLGLDVPNGIIVEHESIIHMPPSEAMKMLAGLYRLDQNRFSVPGVIDRVSVFEKTDYTSRKKSISFNSEGYARIGIKLATGGSIVKGVHFRPLDQWVIEIHPEKGVAHLFFIPGVLRD